MATEAAIRKIDNAVEATGPILNTPPPGTTMTDTMAYWEFVESGFEECVVLHDGISIGEDNVHLKGSIAPLNVILGRPEEVMSDEGFEAEAERLFKVGAVRLATPREVETGGPIDVKFETANEHALRVEQFGSKGTKKSKKTSNQEEGFGD